MQISKLHPPKIIKDKLATYIYWLFTLIFINFNK